VTRQGRFVTWRDVDFRREYEGFIPEKADHKYFKYMNRAGDAMLTVHPEISDTLTAL
jgi:hypothetical protein